MRNLIGKATPKDFFNTRRAQRQSDRCFIALRLDHRRTFCPAAIHRASQLGRSAESHLPFELAHQTFSVSRIWTFSPG